MIGINLSGAEFGGSGNSYGYDYRYPTADEIAYYADRGVELVRLPFKWERMQPTLGGPLSQEELARLKTFLADAHAQGVSVIIDLHNFGRYAGNPIGSASVSQQQFADFWSKLAAALKGSPALVGYDIMNEPHDMGGAGIWKAAAQMAVDAIRRVDMGTTIYIEGEGWSAAHSWLTYNANLIINDPANKLVYQAHQYFDKNNTGTYANSYDADGTYANIGVDRLKPFADWLAANNLKGFIGEFGVPAGDSRWLEVLDRFIKAMEAHGISGTAWGGGFMWSDSYMMKLGEAGWGDSASFNLLKKYIDETKVLRGTSGADTLQGTAGVDRMRGEDGNDQLMGSAGADSVSGGAGSDTVHYGASAASINVDLNRTWQLGGDAEGDLFGSIENVQGSGYGDVLKGSAGSNSLSGNAGNDQLTGRGGADRLDGGMGMDTANYGESAAAVDVDLLRSSQFGGDAQGDVLVGIERVLGSAYADKLMGSAAGDQLIGGAGNDFLMGRGGADVLDGGDGRDSASYAGSTAAVDVDLMRTTQFGGDAAGDTLGKIEDLVGSQHADKLLGNELANQLDGGAGADVVNGRGGADRLIGGLGNDRFVFDSAANAKGDKIMDFAVGDVLDFSGIDANSNLSGNQSFTLIGSKAFSGLAGQLRIFANSTSGTTYISGDTNGDGLADFTVALSGIHTLLATDLLL